MADPVKLCRPKAEVKLYRFKAGEGLAVHGAVPFSQKGTMILPRQERRLRLTFCAARDFGGIVTIMSISREETIAHIGPAIILGAAELPAEYSVFDPQGGYLDPDPWYAVANGAGGFLCITEVVEG